VKWADAGIVDEDIESTKLGDDSLEHRFDICFVGNVGGDANRGSAFTVDQFRDLIGAVGGWAAAIDGNPRTLPRKLEANRTADAARATGNERGFPLKIAQCTPLSHFAPPPDKGNLPLSGQNGCRFRIEHDRHVVANRLTGRRR